MISCGSSQSYIKPNSSVADLPFRLLLSGFWHLLVLILATVPRELAFCFHLHHSTHFFARRFIIRRIILNMRLADNSRRRIHQRSLPLVTQTHCNCRKKHLRGTSRLARLSIAPRLSALRFHFRGWVVSCWGSRHEPAAGIDPKEWGPVF